MMAPTAAMTPAQAGCAEMNDWAWGAKMAAAPTRAERMLANHVLVKSMMSSFLGSELLARAVYPCPRTCVKNEIGEFHGVEFSTFLPRGYFYPYG